MERKLESLGAFCPWPELAAEERAVEQLVAEELLRQASEQGGVVVIDPNPPSGAGAFYRAFHGPEGE